MSAFAATLAPLFPGLRFEAGGAPHFDGRPLPPADPRAFGLAPATEPGAAVAQQLTLWLYLHFHCREPRAGEGTPAAPTSPAQWAERQAALHAANAGRAGFDPGWSVESVEPGGAAVLAKGVRRRREPAGRFHLEDPAVMALSPGAAVAVARPAGSAAVQPGFYHLFGPVLGSADDERRLVRIYWHLRAESAADWVASISRRLGGLGLPFRAKVLVDAQAFRRCDAAVLYLARRHFAAARAGLLEIAEQLRPGLGARRPPFTLPLAPGVALAEDPGTSFGLHRCGLLAAGWTGDLSAASDPCGAAERAFRAAGLDPLRPYLEPGSHDRYV
jgi:hypothetical protein